MKEYGGKISLIQIEVPTSTTAIINSILYHDWIRSQLCFDIFPGLKVRGNNQALASRRLDISQAAATKITKFHAELKDTRINSPLK